MTDARLGRTSVRVLIKPSDTPGRLARTSTRALVKPTTTPGRAGRASMRVLVKPTDTPGRVARLSARVLLKPAKRTFGWGTMLGGSTDAYVLPTPTSAGFRVDTHGSPTGSGTVNIPLPTSAAVDDLAVITTGHRVAGGVPVGATQVAESIGGQSTANAQTTRTSVIRLTSTHVANGYVPFTSNWGSAAYGFTTSVQLVRSNISGYLATFDVAAAGPTSTNSTSKITPTFTFTAAGRRVFHQATFFQNSGGVKTWTFPASNDQAQSSVDREYAGICTESYDPVATSWPARTWTISGGVNGGVGTTAVAIYLAAI